MSYKYQTNIRPIDFWLLSMDHTYRSLIGVCNIIFGVAMILLTVRFWHQAGDVLQAVLCIACLIIPVIQPIGVYLKAKAQTAVIPQGTELDFEEDGIHVFLDGRRELIRWNRVKRVKKEKNMIIVFTDASHGYMLPNRVLGKERDNFYRYVESHIGASGK